MLPSLPLPFSGVAVSTYGVVRTVCIFLTLVLTTRLNERQGIAASVTLTLFALGVPAAILGAHVLDMLEYWGQHGGLGDLLSPTGSSIYGAFFAGFGVGWGYLALRQIAPLKVFDAAAPAMALGEALTRIGCFLNGCCYGIPWTGRWAVTFPPASFAFGDQVVQGLIRPSATHSLPVHPVQLYSTAVMLAVTLYLTRKFLRPHREGEVFFSFLVAYGALRLLVAPLRVEALASMKIFSAGFVVIGSLGLLAQWRATTFSRAVRSA